VKKDEMDKESSSHWENRNACRVLVAKSVGDEDLDVGGK
jgi:ERCC4-related helicase